MPANSPARLARSARCRSPVSAPFHSSLLAPARDRLAARLAEVAIAEPRVPVIANVDAAQHGSADSIRDALARQACSPVQWVKTMHEMEKLGVTHMIECGPGKVLTGLARRCVPSIPCYPVHSAETLEAALQSLSAAG